MEVLVETNNKEGLHALMGKRVMIWCCRYIYAGKLIGVNEQDIKLTECGIVYETGPLNETGFSDYQELPNDQYIRTASIESYGECK